MQFDRLYFSVGQIEAEIRAFWPFGPSKALPDIWTGKNTSRVGPEVPMTERTGRTGNFNTSGFASSICVKQKCRVSPAHIPRISTKSP